MKKKLIITALLVAATSYIITAASPAISYEDKEYDAYIEDLNRRVQRNHEKFEAQLQRDLATPVRPKAEWFYSPAGKPLGYIERNQMYDTNGRWIGTPR